MNARSVGESSTTMIFLMAISASLPIGSTYSFSGEAAVRQVGFDSLQQALFGEGLGEIFVRPDHAAAGAIEKTVLGRQHDHRRRLVLAALLDERTRLIAVEARHHDVDEDEVGLVVGDLR